MDSYPASDLADSADHLTAAILASLEDCSEESVYAPGYIQSHGVLLHLQRPDLTILQVSVNVAERLGVAPAELLGQPLSYLFSPEQLQPLLHQLTKRPTDTPQPDHPLELQRTMRVNTPGRHREKSVQQVFRVQLHQTADALLLELEPHAPLSHLQPSSLLYQLPAIIQKLRQSLTLEELAQTLAMEVKAMVGCDRVMVYRFEPDDSGVVIAEAKADGLESFLGLHYPATDIPAPARRLFQHNWLRYIPAVSAPPAILVPLLHPHTNAPLDLSSCELRGVSPCHVDYLQNMGVRGSMTISLSDGQRLWGLIACHSYQPIQVDVNIRKACEFLGQFASIELIRQQSAELGIYQTYIQLIQTQLLQSFIQGPDRIEHVLSQNAAQIQDFVGATGIAIAFNTTIYLAGITPSLAAVQDLVEWLTVQKRQDNHWETVFATNTLAALYPPALEFKQQASGLLAISILVNQLQPISYHILWFRPEQVHTVNWAGRLQDSVTVGADGKPRLCPRQSFNLWQQTVQATSYPWRSQEIDVAVEMRNMLMLAVLEFSHRALAAAAERAAEASRAKSQFLAQMSHELRTPLNAILGFASFMHRNANLPSEFHDPMSIISRSGEHLLTLINDVLEMSRIEAGQLTINSSSFDLYRLLETLKELLSLKASSKGLKLHFEVDDGTPQFLESDATKIRQILLNLLSNAIKFTVTGSVTLRVKARPLEQSCDHPEVATRHTPIRLQFEVEDTGVGVESDQLDLIFEPFMQTEAGRYAQGTGLGLSISRQFAQLLGGDIVVNSTVNQGSVFRCEVVVCATTSMDVAIAHDDLDVIGLLPDQPTYRILVAEDVPENRQLIVQILTSVGFEVQTATTGTEAIARWEIWEPHLILMDIQMPELDGYATTRRIRQGYVK